MAKWQVVECMGDNEVVGRRLPDGRWELLELDQVADKLNAMPEWVPVSEKLPAALRDVLFILGTNENIILSGWLSEGYGRYFRSVTGKGRWSVSQVKWWCYAPPLPKE